MAVSSKRIAAFQGLRAIAFLAIFISHADTMDCVYLGTWGVSVFLILSGFLSMYSYIQKPISPNFGYRFAWQKIKGLYPLHITMTLMMAVYVIYIGADVRKTLLDAAIHTLMAQMWIPHTIYYTTLNGPAWYLCVAFFCYLMFPLILRFFKRHIMNHNIRRVWIYMFIVFAIQTAYAFLMYTWGRQDDYAWFNVHWATYYAPPARLLDFGLGCGLGYLFYEKQGMTQWERKPAVKTVLAEIVVWLLICGAFVIYHREIGIFGTRAFKFTWNYTLTTMALIWIVAVGRGFSERILSCKLLTWIGDLSPYMFLIHTVALRYVTAVMKRLQFTNIFLYAAVALAATIVGAAVWKKLEKLIEQRKN